MLANEKIPAMGVLTSLAILGALNLLVVLPFLLLTGLLGVWWRPVIALLISTQIGIAVEVFLGAKPWRAADPGGFGREFLALLLNPIAALRSGDVLLTGLSKLADTNPAELAQDTG
jgi:hypothetical protein